MVQVENGKIIKWQLPKVSELKDGMTVSGYHLLDEETLLYEGWLPLKDIQPEYDEETQYLMNDGYEILEDKVLVKYKIEDIPEEEYIEPEPSEMDILKNEITELKQTIDIMLGGEIIE